MNYLTVQQYSKISKLAACTITKRIRKGQALEGIRKVQKVTGTGRGFYQLLYTPKTLQKTFGSFKTT